MFDRLETKERKRENLGYCVCTKGEKTMTLGFVFILDKNLESKASQWADPLGLGSTGHAHPKGVPDPSCYQVSF